MKIVYIYGPPAVGKLTVAQELVKLTSYKIFHNHLSTNIARIPYEIGSPEFIKLKWKICQCFFDAAYKENVNFIYTVCYAGRESDPFVRNLINKYGDNVFFVQLFCEQEKLYSRVESYSRKKHNKLVDTKKLKKSLQKRDFSQSIHYVRSLKIDNTNISAKDIAKMIKKHYKL